MNVGDICNREVVVALAHETVAAAIDLMRTYHIGDLVVVDQRGHNNRPIGIVTDRDILISVVAEKLQPEDIEIGDLMCTDLLTANVSETPFQCLQLMRENCVRRLPVVDDDEVLQGIVTLDDMLGFLAEQLADLAVLAQKQAVQEARRIIPTRSAILR